jgi:hypothetical protein
VCRLDLVAVLVREHRAHRLLRMHDRRDLLSFAQGVFGGPVLDQTQGLPSRVDAASEVRAESFDERLDGAAIVIILAKDQHAIVARGLPVRSPRV